MAGSYIVKYMYLCVSMYICMHVHLYTHCNNYTLLHILFVHTIYENTGTFIHFGQGRQALEINLDISKNRPRSQFFDSPHTCWRKPNPCFNSLNDGCRCLMVYDVLLMINRLLCQTQEPRVKDSLPVPGFFGRL